MGPTLFILYINDIDIHKSETYLFADDTTLTIHDSKFTNLRNRMMEAQLKATDWYAVNKLIVNNDKTKHMIFTYKRKRLILTNSLIMYHSSFGRLGWGHSAHTHTHNTLSLQRKALRIISKVL